MTNQIPPESSRLLQRNVLDRKGPNCLSPAVVMLHGSLSVCEQFNCKHVCIFCPRVIFYYPPHLDGLLSLLYSKVRITLHVSCLFTATASTQELITCYQRDRCSSAGLVFERVTVEACCDNVNGGGLSGIGLGASFQLDGIEGCTPFPIG